MAEWILAVAIWCSVNAGTRHGTDGFNSGSVQSLRAEKMACQKATLKCLRESQGLIFFNSKAELCLLEAK